MQNNIHQTDIEEFTAPPIKDFIAENHTYIYKGEELLGVTRYLGGGGSNRTSDRGDKLHLAMAMALKHGDTIGFKDCHPDDLRIPKRLAKFLGIFKLKVILVEEAFHHEIEGIRFGGRIDAIAVDDKGNRYNFDWKSGDHRSDKHHIQLATYNNMQNGENGFMDKAKCGFIFYNDKIVRVENNLFETEFKPRLLAYHGKLEGKFWHGGNVYSHNIKISEFSPALKELRLREKELEKQAEEIKKQQAELEEEIKELKALATSNLNMEEKEGFLDENIMLSWTKGKNSKKLTEKGKKELEKLKDKNPQWFETTVGKPYYTLRLATEYKETKECS